MSNAGLYDDPDGYAEWMESQYNPSSKPKKNVRYTRGETIRTYKHRVLHIHFPQTEAQWKKASRKRRQAAMKGRSPGWMNTKVEYADPFGLTSSQRRKVDYYKSQERKKQASEMGIEEMRALLKDEHWEEVCNHTRWKYDRKSTIKEFNRYLMSHRGMY